MSFRDITANKNFLSPVGFKFVLTRLPNVDFFCQSATLPSVVLGDFKTPTMFQSLPMYGTELMYGKLQLTFKIDEDLKNFREIHEWMNALGITESFEEYSKLADASLAHSKRPYSDGSLMILTSSKNPTHEIKFLELFPTSLSGMSFSAATDDISYMEATVEFAFRNYTFVS